MCVCVCVCVCVCNVEREGCVRDGPRYRIIIIEFALIRQDQFGRAVTGQLWTSLRQLWTPFHDCGQTVSFVWTNRDSCLLLFFALGLEMLKSFIASRF